MKMSGCPNNKLETRTLDHLPTTCFTCFNAAKQLRRRERNIFLWPVHNTAVETFSFSPILILYAPGQSYLKLHYFHRAVMYTFSLSYLDGLSMRSKTMPTFNIKGVKSGWLFSPVFFETEKVDTHLIALYLYTCL